MVTREDFKERCSKIDEDINSLSKQKTALLWKQRKGGLNDDQELELFDLEERIRLLQEDRHALYKHASSAFENLEIESKTFGTADREWIELITGIDATKREWKSQSTEDPAGYFIDISIKPSDGFQQRFEEISKACHMTHEAGRRIFLNLFLIDIILRREFQGSLRIYPELDISVEIIGEGAKKRRLCGKADYTIGSGKYVSPRGELSELCIFDKAPPRELHLLAMEAKTSFDTVDFWQCVAEMAAIYKARVDAGKTRKSVWGIFTNAMVWQFLRIDEEGKLWQSKRFIIDLEAYQADEVLMIYRLIHFTLKRCFEACSPVPSLYASAEPTDA